MAVPTGIEPAISCVTGRHVNRYTTGPYVYLFDRMQGSLTANVLYLINSDLLTFLSKRNGFAWRRPTLTGGSPLLPSALKSLTSVFGMGTGVTSSPSSPDNERYLFVQNRIKPTLSLKLKF